MSPPLCSVLLMGAGVLPWKIQCQGWSARSVPWLEDHDQAGGLIVITAYRASLDGRHRRYIVARTAGELLEPLAAGHRLGAAAVPGQVSLVPVHDALAWAVKGDDQR